MRWGIVTAAVIAVARSLWLSLIVDRTISKHRGRPMRTRTLFSLALGLLPFAGGEAFAAERRVALVIGNSSYIHAPALDNPVNDVTAVSVHAGRSGLPGGRDAKQSRQHGNAPGDPRVLGDDARCRCRGGVLCRSRPGG